MNRFVPAVALKKLAVAAAAAVISASALTTFMATAASAAAGCTVTVVTTDQNGQPDQDVKPFTAPCRPGESNGDIETYNPYTDSYTVQHDVPLEPIGSTGASTHGSSSGSAGASHPPTSTCTPVANGGTKIHKPTVQQAGHRTCPATSASHQPSV
jgi:hypothetical protein